jgi:protein TonB
MKKYLVLVLVVAVFACTQKQPGFKIDVKLEGAEGKILLEVVVKEDGSALNVRLISSSGSSLLDESAIEAVKNWQFIPAKKFGKFVQAKVIVPIEFKII